MLEPISKCCNTNSVIEQIIDPSVRNYLMSVAILFILPKGSSEFKFS